MTTKIDGLMKKLFFRSNSPCTTYLFLFFTGRTNIQDIQRRPWDVYVTSETSRGPNDDMLWGRLQDVRQTCFLSST